MCSLVSPQLPGASFSWDALEAGTSINTDDIRTRPWVSRLVNVRLSMILEYTPAVALALCYSPCGMLFLVNVRCDLDGKTIRATSVCSKKIFLCSQLSQAVVRITLFGTQIHARPLCFGVKSGERFLCVLRPGVIGCGPTTAAPHKPKRKSAKEARDQNKLSRIISDNTVARAVCDGKGGLVMASVDKGAENLFKDAVWDCKGQRAFCKQQAVGGLYDGRPWVFRMPDLSVVDVSVSVLPAVTPDRHPLFPASFQLFDAAIVNFRTPPSSKSLMPFLLDLISCCEPSALEQLTKKHARTLKHYKKLVKHIKKNAT
jgi:hypothetical protein